MWRSVAARAWVDVTIGGLGHIAVQYARAMGLCVVAVDIDDAELALAARLGAAERSCSTACRPATSRMEGGQIDGRKAIDYR